MQTRESALANGGAASEAFIATHSPDSVGMSDSKMNVGESQLVALCKRTGTPLPPQQYRGDKRCRSIMRMYEIADRFDFQDPSRYTDLIRYFRGVNDAPGKTPGRKVWHDLQVWCGQTPNDYEQVSNTNKLKLSIEHWYKQSLVGDRSVYINGLAWLDVVEFGINNSSEFKSLDGPAQEAFLGHNNTLVRRALARWTSTKDNHKLPSLCFLRSTECPSNIDTSMIYLCTGRKRNEFPVQLTLPAAWFTRAATKRARERSDEEARVVDVTAEKVLTETAVQREPSREPPSSSIPSSTEHRNRKPRRACGKGKLGEDGRRDKEQMTGRGSWTAWTISDPFVADATQGGGGGDMRCLVTCPECKGTINVAAANAKKNLSLTCRQHLKVCKQRKDEDEVLLPDSKRPRTEVVCGGCTALVARTEECATLVAQESRLVQRNDELNARVHTLEAQLTTRTEELRLQIEQLQMDARARDSRERDREARDRERDARIELLSRTLGFQAPPIPPMDQLVDKVASMVKAAAAGSTAPSKEKELAATITRLRKQLREKMDVISQLHSDAEEQRGRVSAVANQNHAAFLRELSKRFHPDKAIANGLDRETCGKVMAFCNTELRA